MSEKNKINRRKAIGGLGLGIAALAGAPVLSSSAAGFPGQPAELGAIYVQLAANEGSYSTGQIYGAAGGGGQP